MARAKDKKQVDDGLVSADEVVQAWLQSNPSLPELAAVFLTDLSERVAAAIRAAIAAERAACLQIAEQEVEVWIDIASDGGQEAARGIANFIRDRG